MYTQQAANLNVISNFCYILGLVSWKEGTPGNIKILFTALLYEIIFPLLIAWYIWLKHYDLPSAPT